MSEATHLIYNTQIWEVFLETCCYTSRHLVDILPKPIQSKVKKQSSIIKVFHNIKVEEALKILFRGSFKSLTS